MTRVLVADDHPLMRDALTSLLANEDDIDVLGAAADGREAVAMARRTSPDVLLLDL
jgi:DNA-binding NarL/FixJ family response regulator